MSRWQAFGRFVAGPEGAMQRDLWNGQSMYTVDNSDCLSTLVDASAISKGHAWCSDAGFGLLVGGVCV